MSEKSNDNRIAELERQLAEARIEIKQLKIQLKEACDREKKADCNAKFAYSLIRQQDDCDY